MARQSVVFALGEVCSARCGLVVRVADVDSALARAEASRPVYGAGGEVLLVGRDPFAGEVTVCSVPT